MTKSELVDRLGHYMAQVDLGTVTQLCGGGGLMSLDKLKSTLWKNGAPAHVRKIAKSGPGLWGGRNTKARDVQGALDWQVGVLKPSRSP